MNWNLQSIITLSLLKKPDNLSKIKSAATYNSIDNYIEALQQGQQSITFPEDNNYKQLSNEAAEQIALAEKNDIQIVTYWDDAYPQLLKEIDDPPIVLYVKGTLQQSDALSISIVGTRHCTHYGKLAAEKFAADFVSNNIVITSGLAYGIDSVAHRSAIDNGGITYAVIASGIDKINTQISIKLAEKIIESNGAIITEFRCGTNAFPPFFLQRNRIISGISKATLVVECGYKSGALSTARHALKQNREVFAVPGPIFAAKSIGCNQLIHGHPRLGNAFMAISPTAMLEDIGIVVKATKQQSTKEIAFNTPEEKLIYSKLSDQPQHIDTITELTGLDIPSVSAFLLEMEFDNLVKQLPGKHYVKAV
ncbi:MAG: DNA-processing protein DprA [Ignavibacteria bacterium]|jgi:DNA processing protein|nr:DNA-processing protein DprA [Ignavibacteria bacterium]